MKETAMQPTLYMLIGLPGSGKSTWMQQMHFEACPMTISTDIYIEAAAKKRGATYDQVFFDTIKPATAQMLERVKQCGDYDISAIWDQTNLTAKSRAKKLKMLPNHRKIAVVFQADAATLEQRRAGRPGKTIPKHALRTMKLELPSTEEGFDEIIWVNQ